MEHFITNNKLVTNFFINVQGVTSVALPPICITHVYVSKTRYHTTDDMKQGVWNAFSIISQNKKMSHSKHGDALNSVMKIMVHTLMFLTLKIPLCVGKCDVILLY